MVIDVQKFLTKYRLELAEAGLKECQNLRPEQKGNMVNFYEGSIESFEHIKELTLDEIEVAVGEARQEDHRLYSLGPCLSEEQLAAYWKQRGRTTQLEFVYDRLGVMKFLLMPKEASDEE